MGELTRFTLVRDVQRREPTLVSFLPLLPPSVTSALFDELEEAGSSESVQEFCRTFLEGGNFASPESLRDHPLGRLSAWLRVRGDRATLAELRNDSPLAGDPGGSLRTETPLEASTNEALIELRLYLAESFVVALLVPDADPKVAPALLRLLLVTDLVEMLLRPPQATLKTDGAAAGGDEGGRARDAAEREAIYAALHFRRILLPEWLSRYPELTRRTTDDLLRRSRLVREPAMSDFYVVEDEWHRYEAAEVAHIENLLPRERKERNHVRRTESETTTVSDSERTEITEKDTQQADSSEFSVATQTEMELSFKTDLSVDTQGQYGPTAVQTHLAAEIDGSLELAEQTAFRVSREVTARAGSKISERTRTTRTTRALTRITETNCHRLDNSDSTDPVVGVYRWVEQVRRLRVMRYPNRYLLEFLVPEPAAWWRWLKKRDAVNDVTLPAPIPFTADGKPTNAANPELTAADMKDVPTQAGTASSYLRYAGRYGTVGLEPPPQNQVLSTSIARSPGLKSQNGVTGIAKPSNDFTLEWNTNTTLAVPSGWQATSWCATILAWHDGHFTFNNHLDVFVSVGAGPLLTESTSEGASMTKRLQGGEVGPISSGNVPIGVMLDAPFGYYIAVEVTCAPTEATMTRWRQRTYEAIRQAYELKESEYREAVSAAQTRAGVAITGLSAARAREVEKAELKKHVITLMRGRSPQALKDPWDRGADKGPVLKADQLPRDELLFLEQAMEWENMRYVHYPYFWMDQSQWADVADLSMADPLFAAFLRAGSTRVVVPARPGFEEAVCFYTRTLIPWGGLGAPAPNEEGYLSVADEVAALSRGPVDGIQVGPTWEIRLPTELTCLAEDPLPTNAASRIPAPPAPPAPPA